MDEGHGDGGDEDRTDEDDDLADELLPECAFGSRGMAAFEEELSRRNDCK